MKDLRRKLILGLIFGFVVLLVLIFVGDIRQVGTHLASFNWRLAPAILGATLFNYVLRFFKWHYYLHLIEADSISLLESGRLFVAGFPLAVTPGKVLEALKAVWLNALNQTPVARGVTVVLAERISDGLAVLVLSSLGVIAYPQYWPAFAIVLGMLLLFIVISQIRPLALALLAFAAKLPIINKIADQLSEFYEGAYLLFRPIATIAAVSVGSLAWLGEGVAMYLVLIGLGVPAGWESFSIAVFTLSFSTVIGAVSALPGGLGAAEATIAGMLTLLLGLDGGTAAAATLLIRFATLWFGVGLGLVVWSFSRDLLFIQKTDPDSESEATITP
jgi:glycosyltransferase 2 family protein